MNQRGNRSDNAQAKSFWSWLKIELLDVGSFPGLEEAQFEPSHYITYENVERSHSALGYRSPDHFQIHPHPTSQSCSAKLDYLIRKK